MTILNNLKFKVPVIDLSHISDEDKKAILDKCNKSTKFSPKLNERLDTIVSEAIVNYFNKRK